MEILLILWWPIAAVYIQNRTAKIVVLSILAAMFIYGAFQKFPL